MTSYGLDIVRAFVASAATGLHPVHPHIFPTVTLSRDYGSGGEDIARQLAIALNVRCFDRELVNAIAAETHSDPATLARLDERVRSLADQWLHNFFLRQNTDATTYQLHLIHVMLDIAEHQGGVIVGRGGHLIVPRSKAFRVRISGSVPVCAARIEQSEGLAHFTAEEKVRRINRERSDFIRTRFGHDPADVSVFDLIVCTDRIDIQEATQTILFAMEQAGFVLPEHTSAALHAYHGHATQSAAS